MPDRANREQMIYAVEDKVPVGSIDKAKAGSEEQEEQYPIPWARPVPWQD
jgi:hypothetical protein